MNDVAAREPTKNEALEARDPVDLAATVTETTPVGAGHVNATELEAIVEIAGGQQVIRDEHAEAAEVEKIRYQQMSCRPYRTNPRKMRSL